MRKIRLMDIIFMLFLLVIAFDPTGTYTSYLKFILFAALVCYGFGDAVSCNRKALRSNVQIILSLIILPIVGISVAIISGSLDDVDYALGHMMTMLFVLMFFYISTMNLYTLLKCFWFVGVILSIVTLSLIALSQLWDFQLIYSICIDNPNFMMAVDRNFLGIPVNGVYFRCGPWIMFAFIYHLYKYHGPFKIVLSIILYLALALCGSRTPFIMHTIILLVYFYDTKIFGRFVSHIGLVLGIIGILFLAYNLATQKDESSNELKFANVESYVEDIFSNNHLLIGAGVGSVFYAKGNGEKLAFSELSYFDLLRMYGIFMGTYFALMYFVPVINCRKYYRNNLFLRRFMLGYCLFLILAGTNPLLLGPIAIIPLTVAMSICQRVRTGAEPASINLCY